MPATAGSGTAAGIHAGLRKMMSCLHKELAEKKMALSPARARYRLWTAYVHTQCTPPFSSSATAKINAVQSFHVIFPSITGNAVVPQLTMYEHLQGLVSNIEGKISGATDISCWNQLLKGSPSPVLQPAKPQCVVHVANEQDVVKAVGFAVEHRLRVSAKGTGHHYGGAFLPEGGMLLDLAGLKEVSVDPVTRTATIGPGVTSRMLAEALHPHGLHFPVGHISQVGCAGFILGGGNGWGEPLYGAAADNVESFRVVLPQEQGRGPEGGATVVEVTQESDPDLFAGLKGAGAFLGIVTQFKLRLHPVPSSLPVIAAVYPASCVEQVAAAYLKLLATGPASVEPSLALVRGPQGPNHEPLVILSATAFAETSDSAAQGAFDQIRHLEPDQRLSLEDCVMPYLQALSQLDSGWEWPGLCLYAHGMFIEKEGLTPDLAKRLSDLCSSMTSTRSLLLVAPGAPPSPHPSSLCFRGGLFVSAYAMWPRTEAGPVGDGDVAHVEWVRRVEAAVGGAAVGLYVNEVMNDQAGQVAKCYDKETLSRLVQLKARCDPLGLLRSLS